MERHHGGEVGPGACHVEHHRAPKTVTDRRDPPGVDVGIPFQLLQRRVEPRREHRRILRHLAHERLRLLRMRRHLALAEHVQREADVARLGETPRLVPRVLVVAPPFVNHQHAGALAPRGVVPRDESLQDSPVLPILDFARLDVDVAGRKREQHGSHRQSVPGAHASSSSSLMSVAWNADNRQKL